jgi:hypothetical protein
LAKVLIKGNVKSNGIVVQHYISKGLPNVNSDEPELSAQIFEAKKSLILFIKLIESNQQKTLNLTEYIEIHPSFGVLIADKKILIRLKNFLND